MHFEELNHYFDFPSGIPSHDTYQRLWNAISPDQLAQSFFIFTRSLEKIAGTGISIDGKTVRKSGQDKPLPIVSAWCQANQLVLAQEKVEAKSNEITAIPLLLKLLDLENRIVTIDAMGAQREICQHILNQKGDYLISLKGNQGTLHKDVQFFLESEENHQKTNTSADKGHGRLEERIAAVSSDIDWLQKIHQWPGLKSIGKITARVQRKGKETQEMRYYISSLDLEAHQFNDLARAHWGIENQLHWRLDVVFNEDGGCVRNDNAAENMDILRKWALNILQKTKTKPTQSIKSLMRKNAMSIKHLAQSVKTILHA